jgi:hypothetical protein
VAALLIKMAKLSLEQQKMANVREKAQCVAWFIEKSLIFRFEGISEQHSTKIHLHVPLFVGGTKISW